MRDIKFRAWAKYGEMLTNVQNHIGSDEWAFGNMLNSDDFVIMQFTGLKDKNGVEIYEGDIVKSHFYGEEYDDIAKIEYDNSSAAFAYDSAEQDAFVYGAENGQLEVIGNIYENPELLK